MCMGVPMQVLSMQGTHALCEAQGQVERVDMLLVGDQPVGTWILNFLGAAREVLDPTIALHMQDALQALSLTLYETQSASAIDSLFADLIDREPPLPEHLCSQVVIKG